MFYIFYSIYSSERKQYYIVIVLVINNIIPVIMHIKTAKVIDSSTFKLKKISRQKFLKLKISDIKGKLF